MKDIFAHFILIMFPVLLVTFFNYVFSGTAFAGQLVVGTLPLLSILTTGFALTFQIHGSSLSYEYIADDFFTWKRYRLMATPVEPRKLVLSTMVMGTVTSILQTFVVIVFCVFVLRATFTNLPIVAMIFIASVILNQLVGTVVLFLSRSVKTANIITSVYGAVAPMTVGLYFPLPDTQLFLFIRQYLTPMALANTAILKTMESDWISVLKASIPMLILIAILFMLLKPMVRKVLV